LAAAGGAKETANSAAVDAEVVEVEVVHAAELKSKGVVTEATFEAAASTAKVGSADGAGQAADKAEEKPENPFMKMFKPVPEEPEPPFPVDDKLKTLAYQFQGPRAITQQFIFVSIGFNALLASKGAVWAACGACLTKWLYGSFLLASVFCHLARSVKLDALKTPEVKLLNLAVVASALHVGLAGAAAAALTTKLAAANAAAALAAAADAPLAVAAALPASLVATQVPIGVLVYLVLPSAKALWRTGLRDLPIKRPFFKQLLDPKSKPLATLYGVCAVEALLSFVDKPTGLPLLRAAVLFILHMNVVENNQEALASDKFRKFNTGILYSSFPLWALASAATTPAAQWAGKAAVVACGVAATWGGKVHEEARKARDLANEANGVLDLAAGTGSAPADAALKPAAA